MINTPRENLFSDLSTWKQRELLQKNNPDMLAWVFNKVWDYWYNLINLENVLCCYPNQLDDGQIVLPEDFEDGNIVILDMWALRKWETKIIAWNESDFQAEIQQLTLLSPWVIEYYEWNNWKKYTQTVLRDGWKMNNSEWIIALADANKRTTTAWRNFSWKLSEDLEVENAEESPFLMQNQQGEYVLVTHDISYIEELIASINSFLEKKYLSPWDDNYDEVKAKFEIKFKWVQYDDLGEILKGIIQDRRIEEYQWEEANLEWIVKDKISLGGESWEYYVFHDEKNNTIEYRAIRKISWFPEWLTAVWRVPLRLFLESQNQDPSFKRLDRIWSYGVNLETWAWNTIKLVPAIDDFSQRIQNIVS